MISAKDAYEKSKYIFENITKPNLENEINGLILKASGEGKTYLDANIDINHYSHELLQDFANKFHDKLINHGYSASIGINGTNLLIRIHWDVED